MFLINNDIFVPEPYENEDELEKSIIKIQHRLFGDNRIYLNIKKIIGEKNKKQNIPDGYLIDLTNNKVKEICPWQESNKYMVIFKGKAKEIPIKVLLPKGIIKAPRAPRYTSYQQLISASNLDEVFK